MAPPARRTKRKHSGEATDPRKKYKALSSSLPEPVETDGESPSEFHPIEAILEEKGRKYKIQWKGTDPETGRPYKPTWEPKENANEEAVQDWKDRKAARKRRSTSKRARSKTATSSPVPEPTKPKRSRSRRVIESSSVTESSPTSVASTAARKEGHDQEPASAISSIPSSPLFVQQNEDDDLPQLDPGREVVVHISQPGSSFDPDAYQRFSSSQVQSNNFTGSQSQQLSSVSLSQTQTVPVRFDRTAVVPDSDSFPGSSSYIPSTQTGSRSEGVQHTDSQQTTAGDHNNPEPSTIEEVSALAGPESSAPFPRFDPIEDPSSHTNGTAAEIADHNPSLHPVGSTEIPASGSQSGIPPTEELQTELEVVQPAESEQHPSGNEGTVDPTLHSTEDSQKTQDRTSAGSAQEVADPDIQYAQRQSEPSLQALRTQEDSSQCSSNKEERTSPVPHQLTAASENTQGSSQQDPPENAQAAGAASDGNNLPESAAQGPVIQPQSRDQVSSSVPQAADTTAQQNTTQTEQASTQHITDTDIALPGAQHNLASEAPGVSSSHQIPQEAVVPESSVTAPSAPAPSASAPVATAIHHNFSDFEEGLPQGTGPIAASSQLSREVVGSQSGQSSPVKLQSAFSSPRSSPGRIIDSIERFATPLSRTVLPEFSSSPLPQAPSQWPESFGTTIPPHLRTPSNMPETRSSPRPASSLRSAVNPAEEFRKRRAAAEAESKAEWEQKRAQRKKEMEARRQARFADSPSTTVSPAPSTLAAELPRQPSPQPDPKQSTRVETMQPGPGLTAPNSENGDVHSSDAEPRDAAEVQVESDASSDTAEVAPVLGPAEYIVPLPLKGSTRDLYQNQIKEQRTMIDNVLSMDHEPDSPILQEAVTFIDRLNNITTHMDLLNEGALTQAGAPPEYVAEWARSISPKFKFLSQLLHLFRDQHIHIVVVVKPGRLMDFLEDFLRSLHVTYMRPDEIRSSIEPEGSGLSATILSSQNQNIVRHAQLVIAMDETFDMSNRATRELRVHPEHDEIAPVISLIVVNSAEHIERCLPSSIQGPPRIKALVGCIQALRQEIGRLPFEVPNPSEAATLVADFMASGALPENWQLPAIGGMPHDWFSDLSQTTNGMDIVDEPAALAKRPLESEDEGSPSKRIRLDETKVDAEESKAENDNSTETVNANDTTHVSDSTKDKSSQQPSTQELQKQVDEYKRLTELLQRQIRERDKDLGDLQHRFEDQGTEKRRVCGERDRALTTIVSLEARIETQATTIIRLKEEKATAEAKIQEERTTAVASSDTQQALLASLRSENETKDARITKLEKQLASKDQELSFFRAEYQNASRGAADLSSENQQLKSEIETLKVKASGEQARVKQIHVENQTRALRESAERAQIMVKERDELLRRKEEEIKGLKTRQGVGTRASSVPMSPRVGPMAGGGSRAASPLPGMGLNKRVGVLKDPGRD